MAHSKTLDLTGKTFGKLTVIEKGGSCNHHVRWICRCECGELTIVSKQNLWKGTTRSCGKSGCREWRHSGKPRNPRIKMEGRVQGMITILRKDKTKKPAEWVCRCSCGALFSVLSSAVSKRRTCGSQECQRKVRGWNKKTTGSPDVDQASEEDRESHPPNLS